MTNDFTTDQNPDLMMWLNSRGAVPDYVLDSSVLTSGDFEKLASNAFADPHRRLYPCNTKEATWMSAAHYVGRGGRNQEIIGNIEKMADWHGIGDDVRDVIDLLSGAMEKGASSEPEHIAKYAFVLHDDDGTPHNFYPVGNGMEVIISSEKAANDYRSRALPLPAFHKAACAIMDAAEENGITPADLSSEVVRYGVRRLPDPYTGEVAVSMRKSAGIDVAPYMALLSALRQGLEKAASHEMCMDMASDVAGRMFMIDEAYGLNYGPKMIDPFTAIFSGPTEADMEKFASTHVQVHGVHVPVTDFLNLGDRKIDASFSKEAASVIKEAKCLLDGEYGIEKCAAASDKVAELSPEAQKVLLATLAGVAW